MNILLETDRLKITEMTMDMAMDVHKNSLVFQKFMAFAFWRIKHQAESLKNVNSKPFLPEKARIMTEYMKLVKAFGRREIDSSQS